MISCQEIVPNHSLNLCLKCLLPTPIRLKLDISSWIVISMITFQPASAVAQPPIRGHETYDMLILRPPPSSHSSQTDSFIVPYSPSTTWSVETMLPMASQMVAPTVRDFNSPSRIVYGKYTFAFVITGFACSTICSALPWLPCLVRCGHFHGNRVINS